MAFPHTQRGFIRICGTVTWITIIYTGAIVLEVMNKPVKERKPLLYINQTGFLSLTVAYLSNM